MSGNLSGLGAYQYFKLGHHTFGLILVALG